jgi:Ca-activated chloride channel homolog
MTHFNFLHRCCRSGRDGGPLRQVVLLAVAQLCCAGLMSETAHAGGWSTAWSDLWRTPDQQGQAMLDAGAPLPAAARFHDPRRRAYADLEAGRYGQAAELLAPFTDAESEYNLGNALAESGQLQAALAAYDAALKLAPADKDTHHNRDLVELALRQRHRQPSPRNGSGSRPPGARGSQSTGSGQLTSSGSQSGTGQSGSSSQRPNAPQATGERRAGSSKGGSGQARRDAAFAAAVARAQRQQRGNGESKAAPKSAGQGPDSDGVVAGGTETPQQKLERERQLMLDQWLRQIPDSPAGLLRRQFLIEHMMRQQNGVDSQGSGQ